MQQGILPIGDYFPQDENGFIINNLSVEKINKKWLAPLKMVTYHLVNYLGDDLHSIYVRGSVVRGLAVDGVSDIDVFALVKPSLSNKIIRWQSADCQQIVEHDVVLKYPFVTAVEMMLATYKADFENSKLAMIIKTQSLLLIGESIEWRLKNYKADVSMALNYQWLESDVFDFINMKNTDFTLEKCSDIMKIILRTGFELVMEQIGKFSPDLYICYRDFSIYYPEKEQEMHQVLIWFLNPIINKKRLNIFVEKFGKWLLQEVENLIKV